MRQQFAQQHDNQQTATKTETEQQQKQQKQRQQLQLINAEAARRLNRLVCATR